MKGRTIIELTDVNTGEVECYEDCNMFTDALDEVFNTSPHWFNNPTIGPLQSANQTINPFTPIVGTALGGLLLFPENIEENADTLFAPVNNKPTGIASFDAYSGQDSRRGSFNEIESGPITNGYRFVWDFSTSQGNGTIKCAALTSARGGAGYWDGDENILKDINLSKRYYPTGFYRVYEYAYHRWVGADNNAVYYTLNSKPLEIRKIVTPNGKFTLMDNPRESIAVGEIDRNGVIAIVEDKLWVLVYNRNTSGNATINIDKYDLATWEKTTQNITISAQVETSNNWFTCVVDGYLLLPCSDGKSVYKVNMSNLADVIKLDDVLTTKAETYDYLGFIPFNGGFLTRFNYVESDGTTHAHNCGGIPLIVDGLWLVNGGFDEYVRVGATQFTPYLATINNMTQAEGYVKNPTQTMKVTYIVTQE